MKDTSKPWSLPEVRPFRTIENEWMGLADGTRLGARLWLPEAAEPVPVVLEYLPYRKRDVTRRRDDITGTRLASHGIAFARVDIRGTGDSEGVLLGEYTAQEQSDALEVIAWLAARPWSNGSVGMRGISWGGFNAFQTAALQPPQLNAIMPCCFTDHQFSDDAHYFGGALSNPNYLWGAMLQCVLAAPPDPEIVGERWRAMWQQRLEALPPILAEWTAHQRYDEHWKRGSVAVDYDRVRCPVYAVCGLNDHYVNVIPRVMDRLRVPRKCLVGAWAHDWPDAANPGPGLAWDREEVRWWEHWLKGVDTGIMSEPAVRLYLCHRTPIETYPQDTPGEWIAEDAWPSPRIAPQVLYLNAAGLTPEQAQRTERTWCDAHPVGTLRGEPDAFFFPQDLPQEQSPEDARSLLFDALPLSQPLDVVGNPRLRIQVRSDVPVAHLAVRLTEVTPEGRSWLVSSGMLNLTHRDSHESPTPLEPGRWYEVEITLGFMCQRLRAGHHLRLALSENFWPLVWPSPATPTLTVATGVSHLMLPIRPAKPTEDAPGDEPLLHRHRDQAGENARGGLSATISGPDANGWLSVTKVFSPESNLVAGAGTRVCRGWMPVTLRLSVADPNSSSWSGGFSAEFARGNWRVRVAGGFELRSTTHVFRLSEFVQAHDREQPIFEHRWGHEIARDLM